MSKLIADIVAELKPKLVAVPAETLAKLHGELDMDHESWFIFQEKKSLAHSMGDISTDNALFIYQCLGKSPEHFNKQPVEVKIVLTQMFKTLLERTRA